jgi:hypothetical protein
MYHIQRTSCYPILGKLAEQFDSLEMIYEVVAVFKVRIPVVCLEYSYRAVRSWTDWHNRGICLVKCVRRAL